MKPLSIILIVAGILMLVFTNINFTTEKKVIDVGPLEVNKKEKKTVAWPSWVGGIAVIAGIVLMVSDKKQA
jgi:UDP-N-acetylmuramyl pentapeptide phosphotransferase/UDP-N-acetylglucosamine-1-phosphate transferase